MVVITQPFQSGHQSQHRFIFGKPYYYISTGTLPISSSTPLPDWFLYFPLQLILPGPHYVILQSNTLQVYHPSICPNNSCHVGSIFTLVHSFTHLFSKIIFYQTVFIASSHFLCSEFLDYIYKSNRTPSWSFYYFALLVKRAKELFGWNWWYPALHIKQYLQVGRYIVVTGRTLLLHQTSPSTGYVPG